MANTQIVMGHANCTLSQIAADDKFNARVHLEHRGKTEDSDTLNMTLHKLDDLKDDIRRRGLINGISVQLVSGKPNESSAKYRLISGFRRFKCLNELVKEGHKQFENQLVTVIKPDATDEEIYLYNLAENVVRKDLTTYEIAARAAMLRKMFAKDDKTRAAWGSKIADKLHLTRGYCNNLMRAIDKLIPAALDAWQNGNLHFTTAHRDAMSGMSEADQMAYWQEHFEKTGKTDKETDVKPKRDKKDGDKKINKPAEKRIVAVYEAIEKKIPESVNQAERDNFEIMKACIGWVLGKFETIPGISESMKVTKKKEEKKVTEEVKPANLNV